MRVRTSLHRNRSWNPVRSLPPEPPAILLLLGALVVGGCSPQNAPTPTATGASVETETAELPATSTSGPDNPTSTPISPAGAVVPQVTPLSGETTTYADPYAGFAFQYPADWNLIPPDEETKEQAIVYSATLSSWEPVEAGTEGIPEGGVKLDVIVVKEDVESLKDAIQWRLSQLEGGASSATITSQETWELPSGLLAQRASVESQDHTAEEIYAVIQGRIVLLSALGDTTIFDRLAVTLEYIE